MVGLGPTLQECALFTVLLNNVYFLTFHAITGMFRDGCQKYTGSQRRKLNSDSPCTLEKVVWAASSASICWFKRLAAEA